MDCTRESYNNNLTVNALSVVAQQYPLPPSSLYPLLVAFDTTPLTSHPPIPSLCTRGHFPHVTWNEAVLDAAALGLAPLLRSLVSVPAGFPRPSLPPTIYRVASSLPCVAIAWSVGHRWGAESIAEVAVVDGRHDWRDMLTFAIEHGVLTDTVGVAILAAGPGGRGVAALDILHAYNARTTQCIWDDRVFSAALQSAERDVIEWCGRHDLPLPDRALALAIVSGAARDVLNWLHSSMRLQFDETATAAAAAVGNLELIRDLRTLGHPWDVTCAASAARGGHLDVLQWVVANGAPWDASVPEGAAAQGHLHVLQWAFEHGVPVSGGVATAAAINGHTAVLTYLASQTPPIIPTPSDLEVADYAGFNRVLLWAHTSQIPMHRRTKKRVQELAALGLPVPPPSV
uniref:Uncharacterized protein n=1 Tax=Sexangularia sp. CB-2014 TaxID=1486929 RepID=A0A7S1Y7N8_9EUKA